MIKKICTICKSEFLVTRYRKKSAKFCSYKCYWHSKKGSIPWNKNLPNCYSIETLKKMSNHRKGKPAWNKGKKWSKEIRKKLSLAHIGNKHSQATKLKMSFSRKGQKHYKWNGGKRKTTDGYIEIYSPNHPFAKKNKCVFEHRLVMEKHIGRYLTPAERVHHIDKVKDNNQLNNLMYFPNESAHQKFHRSLKKHK